MEQSVSRKTRAMCVLKSQSPYLECFSRTTFSFKNSIKITADLITFGLSIGPISSLDLTLVSLSIQNIRI